MAKRLNVPSLQHLARNWNQDSKKVQKGLVKLAEHPPIFSYDAVFSAVADILIFNQPIEEVKEGIRRGIRNPRDQENFLELIDLVHGYFSDVSPSFIQKVSTRFYPAGRGLLVPFRPPLIYGIGGKMVFPWFSFWRSNPLSEKRLSLFVTLVDEVLREDPDLEDAEFLILDFSVPAKAKFRDLCVVNAADIARVSEQEKREMLEVFAEGYFNAQAELAGKPKKRTKKEQEASDIRQGDAIRDLFDEP